MVNASGGGIWETEDAIANPPGTSWEWGYRAKYGSPAGSELALG